MVSSILSAAIAIWSLLVGVGLLRLRCWARTNALVIAGIGLLLFPVGTILSILVLGYLLRGEVRRIFELGEGPATVSLDEARRLERAMGAKA
jgi:hypothetical protein